MTSSQSKSRDDRSRYDRSQYDHSQYGGRRSIAETLAETLGETFGQGGPNATLDASRAGRRAPRVKVAAGIAGLAAAALAFVLLRPGNEPAPVGEAVATLELARGAVTMTLDGAGSSLLTLAAGEPIHAGAVIETGAGADGAVPASSANAAAGAAVRLAGGHSMRLDQDTRVRLASSSSVVLERGAVYVDSDGAAPGAGVEVRTTLGVVRDVGTRFEVRLLDASADGTLRVRVRDGAVVLERGEETHRAGPGVELAVDGEGEIRRAGVPAWGPHWRWVLETAPAPDVAGRPLRVFLDWIERESGWTVTFADEETADVAARTILHGDVRDLSVVEAASVVLDSAGLSYRLEESTFRIAARDSL